MKNEKYLNSLLMFDFSFLLQLLFPHVVLLRGFLVREIHHVFRGLKLKL